MKKIFLVMLIFILIPVLSQASPFFVCDPQTNGTYFQIELDGSVFRADSIGTVGVDLAIYHDVAPMGIVDGFHQARARTCGLWGCDPWTPILPFDKKLPGNSLGFALVP